MARSSNKLLVPGIEQYLDQVKYEIAQEFGVQLGSRQCLEQMDRLAVKSPNDLYSKLNLNYQDLNNKIYNGKKPGFNEPDFLFVFI